MKPRKLLEECPGVVSNPRAKASLTKNPPIHPDSGDSLTRPVPVSYLHIPEVAGDDVAPSPIACPLAVPDEPAACHMDVQPGDFLGFDDPDWIPPFMCDNDEFDCGDRDFDDVEFRDCG